MIGRCKLWVILTVSVSIAISMLLTWSMITANAVSRDRKMATIQSTLASPSLTQDLLNTDDWGLEDEGENHVEEMIDRCMEASNLEYLSAVAKRNAVGFFRELRRVIPHRSIPDTSSHCWNTSYHLKWTKSQYTGIIGDIKFRNVRARTWRSELVLSELTKYCPTMTFSSDLVCLPTLFLAGFPKCGSTFIYCFVNKLVSMATAQKQTRNEIIKEPHFWVRANAAKDVFIPMADHLGEYIMNFIPGLRKKQLKGIKELVLLDGTPNMVFNWPAFRRKESNMTNYCLIPSVLPTLLPKSKYIIVMRNPINMIYSAFWFSCTTLGNMRSRSKQLRGPDLFHERVEAKISMFNNCMRDTSEPSISNACPLDSKENYYSCIVERIHLVDKCNKLITFNMFSPELPKCGRSRIAMGMYFVHVRKWLSVIPRDRFLFLTLEDLKDNLAGVAEGIIEFLGLKISRDMLATVLEDQADGNFCPTNDQDTVDYKHDPNLKMQNRTKMMLEIFYYPFNELLRGVLNRDVLWNTKTTT